VAVDGAAHTAYVINSGVDAAGDVVGDGTVSVIDTRTNSVTGTIHVGKGPQGVAVDGAAHIAYVTNGSDGTVSVIDTRTNTVTATITVGSSPSDVVVDESTHTAYVVNFGDGTMSILTAR
jgi:YVTN family beta-propeller protein